MTEKLHVCISLDVEEEGLFSGKYRSRPTVSNVARLAKLAPLSDRLGFPLTLYCSWAVFADEKACAVVKSMRDKCYAEIAAHLHHWSVPPYSSEEKAGEPTRTDRLAPELLQARLSNLLELGREKTGSPLTSFRMGRWDLKKKLLPFLIAAGISVDSSICPLRAFKNGPDHFLAPASPYWLDSPQGAILETPLTQIPISPALAKIWRKIWSPQGRILDSFHFFGALSANPVWHGDKIMRLAVKSHFARGGRVLNLFWHSSEMAPGASPHIKTEADAERLLARITGFCEWLRSEFEVEGITADKTPRLGLVFPRYPLNGPGDF